jgi:hypothetical protein
MVDKKKDKEAAATTTDDVVVTAADDATPRGVLSVAAWGLVLYAGCRVIEIFLAAQSMAGAVGQAVLVEWGSSRLGVAWTDPKTPTTTAVIARRVAIGAAVGFGIAGVVLAILAVSRGASIASVSSIEASVLAIGFVTTALTAWRDELLHHGIVLRALDANGANGSFGGDRTRADVGKILACGLTSAGAALGRSDVTARSVVVAAALGIVFGAIWLRDRGAWQPWAAHTAFRYTTGTLLAGGFVHTKVGADSWAGGDAGMLGGTAAVIALLPVAALALALTTRGRQNKG